MSPDQSHNESPEIPRVNGTSKESSSAFPEHVLNSLSMHSPPKRPKTGGSAEVPNELISVKAAVGERHTEDEEKIKEYLQRSDTAVIYPEPVGFSENVSPLTNCQLGGKQESDDPSGSPVAFDSHIKCSQCQKGCQTFQALKEHMETAHADLAASSESGGPPSVTPGAASPTPSPMAGVPGGPFACVQCPSSFAAKEQLDKHELLHAPNAQVSCKICNKTFANVYRLQRHMISHDESALLRKFKCTDCDKAFKFKHHLKEHVRIHSGEKPFECCNCGKRFSHSGSYSSHMTSKKCLVMNLKLGRTRAPHNGGGPPMDGTKSSGPPAPQGGRSHKQQRPPPPSPIINNNIVTSPNHNSYLPILPKYSEAAAAFLQATTNPAMAPFYLGPPTLLNGAHHPITPYSMPSLNHIFEQLSGASPLRPPMMDAVEAGADDYKAQSAVMGSPVKEEEDDEEEEDEECGGVGEEDGGRLREEPPSKSNRSSCDDDGDLVMDEDGDEKHRRFRNNTDHNQDTENNEHCNDIIITDINHHDRSSPLRPHDNGDFEAVKRILETVNATVTKQLLQANMHKFSSESSNDAHSISSPHSPRQPFNCQSCKRSFDSFEDHECDQKSEGLAAKLEDIVSVKTEDGHHHHHRHQHRQHHNGSVSGNEDKNEDEMLDCESVTTTDHVSEDGRKVRVRSLISDEQLKVLKDNYKLNPRPKREELEKIADLIGFPVRVVQVWFQNTRARDRREGRLIQVRYTPSNSTPSVGLKYPIIHSGSSPFNKILTTPLSISSPPSHYNGMLEQPLDLSTKRTIGSNESSPTSSPLRSSSEYHECDEVVNLSSRKSSRSPTPYVYPGYQGSNHSSSEPRQSPSPIDFNSTTNRLAQILSQPPHKLALPGMGLVPMEQLMQLGASDLPSLSQLLSNRLNSLSPNSKKRIWRENGGGGGGGGEGCFGDEDLGTGKRRKISQFVLKSLGSPVLGSQEGEIEGQFSCDQCDKAFAKQSSLARHKYEHSGQRPYKCVECPKAFKHKHHLTEHKRLHSGEKPFQCIKCLKRFSHSGSYSQHMNHRYSYCKPYRE